MRRTLITIIFLFGLQFVHAQNKTADSFKHLLQIEKNDTTKLSILDSILHYTVFTNLDSALPYAQQGLLLAKKIKIAKDETRWLIAYGWIISYSGNYAQSIDYLLKGL